MSDSLRRRRSVVSRERQPSFDSATVSTEEGHRALVPRKAPTEENGTTTSFRRSLSLTRAVKAATRCVDCRKCDKQRCANQFIGSHRLL